MTAPCTCERPAISPRAAGPDICAICRRPRLNTSAAVEAKAHRYLAEGRLEITHATGPRIRATCHGSAPYPLGYDPDHGWWCRCPARATCAHLRALQLVTRPEPVAAGATGSEWISPESEGSRP